MANGPSLDNLNSGPSLDNLEQPLFKLTPKITQPNFSTQSSTAPMIKQEPFAATAPGLVLNTAKSFIPELFTKGKELVQGFTRSLASTGQSVLNATAGKIPGVGYQPTIPDDQSKLFSILYGQGDVKDLPTSILERQKAIQDSPLAQKLGLDKHALPLAFVGSVAGSALDLTPFGGDEQVAKKLLEESNPDRVFGMLLKMKVEPEVAKKFATSFAEAKTPEEVSQGLSLLKEVSGIGKAAEATAETPVSKLMTALDQAGKSRGALETAYTAERSARAAKMSEIFASGSGEQGFKQALGAMKGELAPKPLFESPILAQADVDSLFNQIQQHPKLDVFERLSGSNALQKVLTGSIPPRSQLSILEDVFGSDFVKKVLEKRPFLSKMGDALTEVANLPRTLITSMDLSAPLRQGVLLTATHPVTAGKGAFPEMFKQAFSPKAFEAWFEKLPSDPWYDAMRESKLYIANPLKISGGLEAREEKFMSNLAERIPFVGAAVRASERAYVGYLNKLRVDVFKQIAADFQEQGIANPANLKSLAEFVNNSTGRGSLGKFERSAQALNTVFFSPRNIAARFNTLNPVWYAQQTAPVRKEAIKTMLKFVGLGATVLAIAKAGGADVEIDPRSTDFGKIKVGNVRWDIWGGFQQWVRLISQMVSGEKKSTTTGEITPLSGKKFPFETRLDVLSTFTRGKLAPLPALAAELLDGQKQFGGDLHLSSEVAQNAVPLYIQDISQAVKELGPGAILSAGVPSFFGSGVQVYGPKKEKITSLNGGSNSSEPDVQDYLKSLNSL